MPGNAERLEGLLCAQVEEQCLGYSLRLTDHRDSASSLPSMPCRDCSCPSRPSSVADRWLWSVAITGRVGVRGEGVKAQRETCGSRYANRCLPFDGVVRFFIIEIQCFLVVGCLAEGPQRCRRGVAALSASMDAFRASRSGLSPRLQKGRRRLVRRIRFAAARPHKLRCNDPPQKLV